jgi:hypothetical protein
MRSRLTVLAVSISGCDPEPTFDVRDPGRTVGEEFGPDGSRDVGLPLRNGRVGGRLHHQIGSPDA